jgi:hypothetical protein
MRRPASSAFVLGHPTTRTLTIGAAIVSCFAWAGHTVSWLAPALALLLLKASFAASKRVARYQEWRTAWDEMLASGVRSQEPEVRRQERSPAPAPEPKAIATATPRTQPPPVRRPVLISAWLVMLGWLAAHDQRADGYAAVALGFVAVSAWGVCVVLVRLARWLLGAASPARAPTIHDAAPGAPADDPRIVAQCLPVARPLKRTGHVRERLPQYCRDLLARSAAASTNDRL